MTPTLFADMAAPQLLVAGGVMVIAAVMAVAGIAWLGVWLLLRPRAPRNLDSGDVS